MSALPTTTVVECTVPGCGWRAEIPTTYRFEADPSPRTVHGLKVLHRLVVDVAAVEAFDAYLAGHLEQHTIAETLLAGHPDDPGPATP
jgi:hypothetical protein